MRNQMGSIVKEHVTSGGIDLAKDISQKASGLVQSSEHRELLDIVDSLRSNGVSHYVDLPQIIVCGSQSSGKSSTLESISGIAFPTAEGLCTRFATELILRRGEKTELKVQIQPSSKRSEEERFKLLKFCEKQTEQKSISKIIESAKVDMGLSGNGPDVEVFTTDVLRIENTSPDAPNLTLVDLPGLFGASDKNQSDDDSAMYYSSGGFCGSTFPNQPVTKFARQIDPTGARTLGLITKPDKIDRGSDSERYYVEMAQNSNVKLSLGWHVLRNKSLSTIDDTIEQRERREAEFFSDSAWEIALEPSQLGVGALRGRLRDALWKQIRDGLPGVKYDVQLGIKDCTAKLSQLGAARSTIRQKHSYLHQISGNLSTMVQAAIDGVYADPFFASYPGQQDAFNRRLRANIQRILTIYAGRMCLHGHALEIVEDDHKPTRTSASKYVMRSVYLQEVKKLMVECRGRELPGTFNPLVVADLFSRQCQPWESITQNLAEEVHQAASTVFNQMVSGMCDENTRSRLMNGLIQPSLHELRKELKNKLDELLKPHLAIHPITYNDYLTEHVQKIQGKRHDRTFDSLAKAACGFTSLTAEPSEDMVPLKQLLYTLKDGTRPNVEEYSVSLAVDVAAAYYKVALKKFIDDVSVNAVETCLIQKLPTVFSPSVAWELSDAEVEKLGSEDASTVTERADLEMKLEVLETGLRSLDAFTARSLARVAG